MGVAEIQAVVWGSFVTQDNPLNPFNPMNRYDPRNPTSPMNRDAYGVSFQPVR